MKSNTASVAGKIRLFIILAIAALLSLGIYTYQGKNITLEIDGEVENLVSYSNTVEEFIETENIDMKEEAYINLPLEKEIEDNLNIVIKNPKTYRIEDQGESLEIVSIFDKVGEILQDQDISLGKDDYTYPKANEKISPDSSIRIYRVKTEVDVEKSDIDFDKKVVNTKNLDKGKTRIVQEGKKGVKETHTEKKYLNGVLISKEFKKEEITKEPTDQIIEKGTRKKSKPRSSKSNNKTPTRGRTSRKIIDMTATAYDLSFQSTGKRPGDPGYGITASGTMVKPGSVAVDPNVIPLGTRLYIESLDGSKDYGYAVAEDTGGAIKGNRIDLFFSSRNEVMNFGRRKVRVHIVK